jgi:hypothetical protein
MRRSLRPTSFATFAASPCSSTSRRYASASSTGVRSARITFSATASVSASPSASRTCAGTCFSFAAFAAR